MKHKRNILLQEIKEKDKIVKRLQDELNAKETRILEYERNLENIRAAFDDLKKEYETNIAKSYILSKIYKESIKDARKAKAEYKKRAEKLIRVYEKSTKKGEEE